MKTHYATIKRGTVHLPIGSPQDRFLHFKKLPHSHVTLLKEGNRIVKKYKRYYA